MFNQVVSEKVSPSGHLSQMQVPRRLGFQRGAAQSNVVLQNARQNAPFCRRDSATPTEITMSVGCECLPFSAADNAVSQRNPASSPCASLPITQNDKSTQPRSPMSKEHRMTSRKSAKTTAPLRITLANGSTLVGGQESVEKILRLTLFGENNGRPRGPRGPWCPSPTERKPREA
jgi:hypothetical protein